MKRPRRNHTAVFEAKVALAALRVDGKRDVHCIRRQAGRPLHYYLDNNVTRFSAAIRSPRSTDWLTVA